MGGTNPAVIREMMQNGIDVRKHDKLHAKIYLGDELAILTSANASISGLGSEGGETSGWVEAGTVIPVKLAEKWFAEMWEKLDGKQGKIGEQDLIDAQKAFKMHKQIRPTTVFKTYDFHADDFPLIEWMAGRDFEVDREGVFEALGTNDDATKARVKMGVDVLHPADRQHLVNRWILRWQSTEAGPSKKTRPWFVFTSNEYVQNGGRYTGDEEIIPVTPLAPEPTPPVPFDISSPQWRALFNELLIAKQFESLSEEPAPGEGFFHPRAELMRDFWLEMQKLYQSRQETTQAA